MHGLIFVTWENYIAERFGDSLLHNYRAAIGETTATAPSVSRIYDDATLIAGVQALCKLSGVPANTLLREYGRYFIMNGLTSHLCAYFLTRVHSGRELLLIMREGHQQMRRTPDGITPPLFRYEALPNDPQGILLIYDSPRRLCPVLYGAIEGAGERYSEQVRVIERTCMKHGADACRLEVHFRPIIHQPQDRFIQHWQQERIQQQRARQHIADVILTLLPASDGITMNTLQERLQATPVVPIEQIRPRIIFEALRHLQYAGLITSTANQPGDILTQRKFWRVPTQDQDQDQENGNEQMQSMPPVTSPRLTRRLNERERDEHEESFTGLSDVQPEVSTPGKQETGSLLLKYRQQQDSIARDEIP
jgi:hypothetical protein